MSPSQSLIRCPNPSASPSPLAPDRVAFQPQLGWRTWFVTTEGQLLSPGGGREVWPERERFVASCRYPGVEHENVPSQRCRCGVYAWQERDLPCAMFLLAATEPESWCPEGLWPAYGLVSLWGRVLEHRRGWRGAYAYPYSIYVPTRELMQVTRNRYGVDVEVQP